MDRSEIDTVPSRAFRFTLDDGLIHVLNWADIIDANRGALVVNLITPSRQESDDLESSETVPASSSEP